MVRNSPIIRQLRSRFRDRLMRLSRGGSSSAEKGHRSWVWTSSTPAVLFSVPEKSRKGELSRWQECEGNARINPTPQLSNRLHEVVRKSEDKVINVAPWLAHTTLDIIGESKSSNFPNLIVVAKGLSITQLR